MADSKTNTAAPTSASNAPQVTGADAAKTAASQTQAAGKATADEARASAAATFDELLAREALASLKRTRATTTRAVSFKSAARVLIPPAKIVARPPPSQAWMTPFVSLAIVVAVSTSLCAGGMGYLFLRPSIASAKADTELRNLRETVTQLRRSVADLSHDVTANRAALDTANKTATDRLGRLAQSLDRAEQGRTVLAAKVDRTTDERLQAVRSVPATVPQDVTGTVPQQAARAAAAPPDIVAGWHVRRAYDGVAVIEGQAGVIEVALGQDVPGLGRIREIKNQNGRWQIVTTKGVILSTR